MDPVLCRWLRVTLAFLALAALVWLATALAARSLPSPAPAVSSLPPDCLQGLAARLARAGLVGQVSGRAAGELIVVVSPPTDRPPEQAAQVIWDVFDTVVDLPPECPYRSLEVRVPTDEDLLLARVTAADLQAWAAASLDDAALVERVLYARQSLLPPEP